MEHTMPTADQLLGTVASLVLLYAVIKLFTRKPSIEAEFATKSELHLLEQKVDAHITKLDDKISERFDLIDSKRSRQVAGLHEDIRSVDKKVERLLGRLEAE